jgi:hypothetical protein
MDIYKMSKMKIYEIEFSGKCDVTGMVTINVSKNGSAA